MARKLDVSRIEAALKRAARAAVSGLPEMGAGRVLPVVSSMIAGVEYDDETGELDVLFSSGKTYRYFDVPEDIYARLLEAKSKGQFFNEVIKDEYRYAEVTKRRR
jgi:lysyl-tRNA synthetase class 2